MGASLPDNQQKAPMMIYGAATEISCMLQSIKESNENSRENSPEKSRARLHSSHINEEQDLMEPEEAIYNIQISDKQDDSGEMGRGTPV